MNNFVETIRRVGIFMIVAQVVIHLAPGKQYEKYIKLIAGVIVLIQLISPFYQISEECWDKWVIQGDWSLAAGENNLGEILEEKESSRDQMLLQNIQNEIKSRLNNLGTCEGYYVKSVELVLKNAQTGTQDQLSGKDSQSNWEFQKIIVVLQEEKTGEAKNTEEAKNTGEVGNTEKTEQEGYSVEPVQIEPVTWEKEQMAPADQTEAATEAQRQNLAAQISKELGIEESCVEVRVYGDV